MKCAFCEYNSDEWLNVTSICEVKINMTQTENRYGYLNLWCKGDLIGSIRFCKDFSYNTNAMKEKYRVVMIPYAGMENLYFRVYRRKK